MSTVDCVALIPARAGSKRLPGKNSRQLGGKPLIVWSIEAALASESVTRTIVSTDSQDIADIAIAAGAEAPFLRPDHLSGDMVTTRHVMHHLLDWLLGSHGEQPSFLLVLPPTSPFRTSQDIDQLMAEVMASKSDSAMSVMETTAPELTLTLDPGNILMPVFDPNNQELRYQELPTYVRADGSLYLVRPETFLQRETILGAEPYGYLMPKSRTIDIDTIEDFEIADMILKGRGHA